METKQILINEHVEPWRNSEGNVIGFLISLLPALRESIIPPLESKEIFKKEEKDFFIFTIDINAEIVFADKSFCNYIEVPSEEIKGKPIYEFLHSYFIEYLKKQEVDFIEFVK